jgi:hypothetical protein
MTTTYPLFGGAATPGESDAARVIAELGRQARAHYLRPLSRSQHLHVTMQELASVQEECAQAGWDGHGARPVSQDTFRQAYYFLESFPAELPMPSVGAEPDGCLTLEWYRSPRRTLSVSIGASGDLHYSALVGAANAYGTERFTDAVPKAVIDLVKRVCVP